MNVQESRSGLRAASGRKRRGQIVISNGGRWTSNLLSSHGHGLDTMSCSRQSLHYAARDSHPEKMVCHSLTHDLQGDRSPCVTEDITSALPSRQAPLEGGDAKTTGDAGTDSQFLRNWEGSMDSPGRCTSVGSTSMTRAVPVEPLPPACSMIIDMGAHSYSSRSLPVLFFLSGGYLRPQAKPWTRAPLAGRASLHSSDAGPTAALVCPMCCAPVTGRCGKRRTE